MVYLHFALQKISTVLQTMAVHHTLKERSDECNDKHKLPISWLFLLLSRESQANVCVNWCNFFSD